MEIFCDSCGNEIKLIHKAIKVRRLYKSNDFSHKVVICKNCGKKNIVPVIMRMTERY